VETFDAFTADNDPHKERDFGVFEHSLERIFWKIDYYNLAMTRAVKTRAPRNRHYGFLTIMLASEY